MLNSSFPKITATTTLWAGVLPDSFERQAEWVEEVNLAFERGLRSVQKNGIELHFISVPNTDNVAFGMRVRVFESTECAILKADDFALDCTVARVRLAEALTALMFRDVDSIITLFFTTEFRDLPTKPKSS